MVPHPGPPGPENSPENDFDLGGLSVPGSRDLELPADRLMREIAEGAGRPVLDPLDRLVVRELRARWDRFVYLLRDRYNEALPAERRLILASTVAPPAVGADQVPTERVKRRDDGAREYSFCCHLRNKEAESLVYAPWGSFAYPRVRHLKDEQPVAVTQVCLLLQPGERSRFLTLRPESEGVTGISPFTRILVNHAAFKEELDLIYSGDVLFRTSARVMSPLWMDALREIRDVLGREAGGEPPERLRLTIFRVDPLEYVHARRATVVVSTDHGEFCIGFQWNEESPWNIRKVVSGFRLI